jgi:hypothetical protein
VTAQPGVEVHCEPAGAGVDVRIRNRSDAPVHLLDGPRMPYLLRPSGDEIVVLFGVNPPDPDLDYLGIEIPLTRPLAPGEEVRHHATVSPLQLRDHYSTERTAVELHGPVTVRAEVGWGETPITEHDARRISITSLLEWQRLASSEPVRLDLG